MIGFSLEARFTFGKRFSFTPNLITHNTMYLTHRQPSSFNSHTLSMDPNTLRKNRLSST